MTHSRALTIATQYLDTRNPDKWSENAFDEHKWSWIPKPVGFARMWDTRLDDHHMLSMVFDNDDGSWTTVATLYDSRTNSEWKSRRHDVSHERVIAYMIMQLCTKHGI